MEAIRFVIDEAVKGNLPRRAEIESYSIRFRQLLQVLAAPAEMQLLRHAVDRLVVNAVLSTAPVQSLPVQVGDVAEYPINKEVFLYKADEALHLPLRERMPWLAELCLEADGLHERLIILLPYRMSFQIPADDHALHVVREDEARHTHVLKGVDYADEKVFLPRVGKELHIALPAMMTDHSKARHLKLGTVRTQHFCEAPIHLKRFSRPGRVTAASIALRRDLLALCRDEVLVCGDVALDRASASGKAYLLKAFQTNSGIADATAEHAVENR